MPDFKDIDTWRKIHLAIGEWVDAWRLIPRLLVAGYAYAMWKIIQWYMTLEPTLLEGCDMSALGEACIINAPSTQHSVLVTAVLGVAAAVFGLYANTGRKWGGGFIFWNKKKQEIQEDQKE